MFTIGSEFVGQTGVTINCWYWFALHQISPSSFISEEDRLRRYDLVSHCYTMDSGLSSYPSSLEITRIYTHQPSTCSRWRFKENTHSYGVRGKRATDTPKLAAWIICPLMSGLFGNRTVCGAVELRPSWNETDFLGEMEKYRRFHKSKTSILGLNHEEGDPWTKEENNSRSETRVKWYVISYTIAMPRALHIILSKTKVKYFLLDREILCSISVIVKLLILV